MERLTYEIIDGGIVTDKENIKEFEIEDGFTVCGGNAIFRLSAYEDTGLTPSEIMKLKERDTAKTPEIHKNKHSNAYTCPNCDLVLINKDETGWFCGKHYKFCPDCGQRLKWEE